MKNLKITIVQSDIHWENKEKNLSMFDEKLSGIDSDVTDLIVLPEMFSTGFSMNAHYLAEDMEDDTALWLKKKSFEKKVDITGSVIIKENGNFFNRLIWAKSDGSISRYDKRHLFKMAGEDKIFEAGKGRITVDLNGWKIAPFICYDLRFPVWCRNIASDYDIAIFIASWPRSRSAHWRILLQARAVENQCYVLGVNRIGRDGNNIVYDGSSLIINPLGKIILDFKDRESVNTEEFSYDLLKEYRKEFPAWQDADKFRYL